MDSIKVAIKVRPLIKREREDNLPIQWIVQDNSIAPLDPELKKRGEPLYFDHVFDTCKTNYDIFDVIAKPIVNAAINGINGTIFAYGQTSSGKTYTMMGEKDCPGVIPLAVQYIFDQIKSTYDREFLLRVSYIEIYNEKIHDLLDKEGIDLKIKEDKSGQANVLCKEEVVNCPENVLGIMRKGLKNRKIGETNMNDKSSRSHTIFRVIIESREPNTDGVVHVSQLNLVDLAGSERPKQTGATGDRFNEGKHINLSLSSLALVIMQLSEHQDNPQRFVNFRDSKLTRILRSSLGGNAMTTIICAVTPAAVEETQNTLAFASRAKRIHNKPQVNECISEAALLKRYAKQLAKLESQLAKSQGANLEEMESKLMEKESILMEKDRAYQLLEERIELLKTRIVSGNSSPEDETCKRRSNRRRTWGGPGTCQTKLLSFQTLGLPTIKETEKSPEKDPKKEQRKKRQSIIQSMDIPNQTWDSDFTDFELELIESERARLRLSDGSGGGDDDFAVTKRPHQRHVQFREDAAILEEEHTTPEVTPEKKKSEVPSPGTPKSVLRSRLDFLREQFVSLKDDHSSIVEYTTLERQMFVAEAVEAATAEHNKIVESLKEELAQSEKSKQELLEKYEKLESHSAESDKRLENLQKELATSTSSLRALKIEKETLVQELNKLKSPETNEPINQPPENLPNDKETSSIFANCSYFDEMEVSDVHSDSQLTNETTNMESILTTDTSLPNISSTNRMDVSKESKDDSNATYSEFMKNIAEKSNEELVRVTQDLFNAKLLLQEENARLEATLRRKVREADDVGNDIRQLNSGIKKLKETIQILMTENTDLSSKLSHEKEFAKQAEKSFQSTIAELNSSIEKMTKDKTLVEKSIEELHKKSDSSSTMDEETSKLIEKYKQQIKSLITENNELSSNVMNLTEDLELIRAGKEIPGEHDCDYRRSMSSLLERNKSLELENSEMSMNLMDKIEEYDILKKEYELLSSKFSTLSQQEISQNLLNFSINCTNLISNELATDAERSTAKINGESVSKLENCKFGDAQFPKPTVDDLLRLSLPASDFDKILKTNGQTIEDSSQMSTVHVDAPKAETIGEYKLKAQMLEEQVQQLTLLNEKLRELKTSSCKQCAHLVELRQNRKILEKQVKTLTRTLEDLQTKFDSEFADTKILRTKASEDSNLSICDESFNASFNLEGGMNVSVLEERVQSMRNEIESLKTERGVLSNLCKEKCEEIEKLQDHGTRESSPASVDSPRLRRDDVRLDKMQKEMEKVQKDLRVLRKNMDGVSATLQKSDNVKRMQNEIETLKSEKIFLEKKLMETKSFSLASEKCESLENKIASLNSEISRFESTKEQLEREKSLQSDEIESLKLEKEKLGEKLTQESESLEIAREKIQAMAKEVNRLNSLISDYEADTEKLKITKTSLETEMQTLLAEKQILQEKLVEIENSFVPQEKVDSLAKEIARMSAEMKNYEMAKEQLEEAKSSLEAEIRVLKAEKDEGKLSLDENIVQKDQTIESLGKKVSQLLSDLEDSAVVKCQLEDAKSALENEVKTLKTEKVKKKLTMGNLESRVAELTTEIDHLNDVKNQLENAKSSLEADQEKERLSSSELLAAKDRTIEELKAEVARLASEINHLNDVKNQLENAKLSLEADQEKERLSSSEFLAAKDRTIEELKAEVARLASEIDHLNDVTNQLENAKSSLEAEQEKEKLSSSEFLAAKDRTIEELKAEVARLASEIDQLNDVKNQLENAKSSFEAEQEKERLSSSELLAAKDRTIEELKAEVARLASEIDHLNVVKNQLENAKSSLEVEIGTLKADQEKERLSISELIAAKDCTIEELKTEVARLVAEIENSNAVKKQIEEAKSALEMELNLLKIEKESFEEILLKKEDVSLAEGKVKSLENELSRLIVEVEASESTKKHLEEAKSRLENKVESLKEENEAVKQKLLELESVARSQEKIALEEKVESLLMEKTEIQESLINLRETVSKLNEKNASLNEELRSMKSEEVDPGEPMKTARSNGLEHADSSISTIDEKSSLISSYEKILEEVETAKKSMTKEIMSLKPSTEDFKFEEKSTSELFGFFVTTIMAKEQEVVKALSDNFEREKRKLVENKRQSIDAEKRASDWAKELEAEIERNEQDLILEKSKNTALSEKISSLENSLLETKHENQMLKEKMEVLVADFDTMDIKLEKPSETRQNSVANSSQSKERFIPENVDTREMELSSKLRQAEKQYKEKLNELTSSLEHLKTQNIELSNNLEGLEANEKQLQKIIDMKTSELAKCNLTIERMQSELDALTESFGQSSRENVKKDEKISEITSLLKTKCDILSEYKTKLETITPEYEKLKEQANERQLKLEKYKSEIQCLRAENEKTISSLKDRLDSEEMQSVGYRKQLAELTNRNTTLQMELVELQAKCEQLEKSNAKMAQSMRNSTSKIRAEEEMEDLRDQNRTLARNLDGAGNRINELQDAKTRLSQELIDLRVQYETTLTQNEELKSVLSSHRSSVADTIEWREKYEAAVQEKSRLEMELMAKRPRFEQMEKKVEVLVRENDELKAKNVELDAEMDDIVCKINELTAENAKLDDQLYNAQNTIESLKTKNTELTTTNLDFEKKLKDHVDEIESLKIQRNKLRCENGATFKSLNNENSELRTRLSQLDRGDSLSCGDSDRSSSPALEAARVDNRRRRSRNELFNVNRPLEICDIEKDENCQCDIYKQQCKKLEQDLVLKNARIGTLELKIQSEIFPYKRKCKDLEEMIDSYATKNKTLKAEVRHLQEIRAREISSECERCKQWKQNKRDQGSQCMPHSTQIYMSGMSSGTIDVHVKNAKLEKERNIMKHLCRTRGQKNVELEKCIEELKQRIMELERGTKVSSATDKIITSDSSTFNTILIPDSSNPRREAMKENVPAIWEHPKQSLTTRRNWFN